jgi:RimJ/RimL family protein N-acetyltransferase
LRPVKSSLKDAEIEQDYRWSRDEDIVRLWGGAPTELSLDEFRNQLRRERWHPQSDQRSFYVVTHAGELIGRIRLYSIDWTKGEGEMGVFLDKEHWGKQYGREALKLLEQYIFTETPINRIYLLTFKDNVRAQRSFIACGFRAVGVARRYLPSLGEYVEHVQMEITRQDFRDQRTSNRN